MEKGLLHQKKFNLKSPTLEKEMDVFRKELADRMKKYNVSAFISFEKKTGDFVEVVIIPASEQKGAKELAQQGFMISDSNDSTSFANKNLKSVDFNETVTFDFPSKKKK